MSTNRPEEAAAAPVVTISQSVAILVDGNNIERSIQDETGDPHTLVNFDTLVPRLLGNRGLNRFVYFREGKNISSKLGERLYQHYHGSVRPCHKSADIPLTIKAMQLSSKVDTIIILSGDSDYVELVRHLKTEGVRVEIAAIPSSTSHVLKEEADYYHEISREDWYKVPQKRGMPHPRHRQHRNRGQRAAHNPPPSSGGEEG
ncbi:MAG: NYN domain-containing protein [Gammaproteobacteria bacterium]|nr:NYN domain-containing protein [Gammaproteobacteria bacterium]